MCIRYRFGWLFIPTIGGMTLGAFVSGGAAGRISGVRQVGIGFACCGVAALGNVGYNLSLIHIFACGGMGA